MAYLMWFISGALFSLFIPYLRHWMFDFSDLKVEGYFSPEFQEVVKVFETNIRSGKERGAAFAVYHKGTALIDIRAGYADEGCDRKWSKDTITQAFSATKGVTAVVVAHMVEKGLLDYKAPVALYWTEFAQNDKANITVEMLLSHQAGLSVLDDNISIRDLVTNLSSVEQKLAKQAPTWPAGSSHGYHALTYGLYLDRLVQKTDPKHRDIAQYFQEEIAVPFGIDFFMNVPKEELFRAARLEAQPWIQLLIGSVGEPRYFRFLYNIVMKPDSLTSRSVHSVREFEQHLTVFNNPDLRAVTLTAASGSGTAGGLAKLWSILAAGGEFQGKTLLSGSAVQRLSTNLTDDHDVVILTDTLPFSLGTQIRRNVFGKLMFGHTGFGGQVGFADSSYKIGIAYLTNYLSMHSLADDPRFLDLEAALYRCLDKYFENHSSQ